MVSFLLLIQVLVGKTDKTMWKFDLAEPSPFPDVEQN